MSFLCVGLWLRTLLNGIDTARVATRMPAKAPAFFMSLMLKNLFAMLTAELGMWPWQATTAWMFTLCKRHNFSPVRYVVVFDMCESTQ